MDAKNVLIGFFLCLLGTTAFATTRSPRLSGPEFCNLQRLSSTQPTQRFEFEGGFIERWDENDEQLKCVGVQLSRTTVQPNSLFVPSYHPSPLLIYVERGEGIAGVNIPGCAETFDTGVQGQQQQQPQARRIMNQQGQQQITDSHQQVRRFKQGDFVTVPAGAVHWAYNDGNQEFVAIVMNDFNNPSNQLDLKARTFYLAGGVTSQHLQGQQKGSEQVDVYIENIMAGFDKGLLAEAFNTELEIVESMQQSSKNGVIVQVREPMQFITPDEQQQQQQFQQPPPNGVEEKICTSKLFYNLDSQREADIFSEQAGKVNTVNEYKLPILSELDLAAEKGHLLPNALLSPHWSINSHTIVYVLSGDARVQVVSNNGQAVLDQQVSKGDLFTVPQFFAAVSQAGQNGFEWVAFKTNKSPMKSPIAGYTSVFRAMPLDVITNSYNISPSQAQSLKNNRETESILFSPQRTSPISS